MNNSITLKELDCELLDSTIDEEKNSTHLKYINKLNGLSEYISTSIEDKRSNINNNGILVEIPYLFQNLKKVLIINSCIHKSNINTRKEMTY